MYSKKRKCHFNDSLKAAFPFIRAVNNEKTVVHCTLCNSTFSVASGGKTSIRDHMHALKHKNAVVTKAQAKLVADEYGLSSHEVETYHGPSQGEENQVVQMVFQEPFVELHTNSPPSRRDGGNSQVVQLLKQQAEDQMLLKDSLTRMEALLKQQRNQATESYDTRLRKESAQPAFIDSRCIGEGGHSSDTSMGQASFYAIGCPPHTSSSSSWNYNNAVTDSKDFHQYNDNLCSNPGSLSGAEKDDSQGAGEDGEMQPSFQEPLIKLDVHSPSAGSATDDSQMVHLLKQHSEDQMRLTECMSRVEALLAQQVTLTQQMLVLSSKRHATEERLVTLLEDNRLMLVPRSS